MRHPDDPEIVAETKAAAAFCLGVLGAVTGLMIGGLIPATVALVLVGQARADIDSAGGWRSGSRYLRWAQRLAWTGIALAAVAVVVAVSTMLLQGSGFGYRDFPASVD